MGGGVGKVRDTLENMVHMAVYIILIATLVTKYIIHVSRSIVSI